MSAPFGQATVPPSTKNVEQYAGSFSASNTGPSSHSMKSIVFWRLSLNVRRIRWPPRYGLNDGG